MKTGHSYFKDHFSHSPAPSAADARALGDGVLLTSNQAVFIYDFAANTLKYARGFAMLGFDDETITMFDIFNTAIPEHREACGEISGKALYLAKSNLLEPLKNGIVLNYAGKSNAGELLHLMLESSVFELDGQGNLISTIAMITKLPHLPVPNIVKWTVFGDMVEPLIESVDDGLIQPNRISRRETDVLAELVEGKTMKTIALELSISPRTVEKHIEKMRERFSCSNTGQLIAFGKDMGLV